MVAGTARRGGKPFPEIRISLPGRKRPVRLVLTPAARVAAAAALLGGTLGLGCLGAGWIAGPLRLAHADKAAMRLEIVNADLQDKVARLEDRLARTAGERVAAEGRLSDLTKKAGALHDQLASVKAKLPASGVAQTGQPASDAAQISRLQQMLLAVSRDTHAAQAESATLAARVNKSEADRAAQDALYRRYEIALVQAQRRAGH